LTNGALEVSQYPVGTSLKKEKLLTRSLVTALGAGRAPNARSRVLREVDCYLGVADVVTVQWRRAFWKDLAPRNVVPLARPGTALVYTTVVQLGKATMDDLATRLGLALRTVSRHLTALEKAKLVRHRRDGAYRVVTPFPHQSLRLTAYEAKIEKWQRAIYQASRYWSFANRVYVVLPLLRARALMTKRHSFKSMGVGLIGVKKDGTISELLPSAKLRPRSSAIRTRVAALGVLAAQRSPRK